MSSEEYLAELFDRYGSLVWAICYKFTNDYFEAQDLTQDTFLSAFSHLASFDGENERAWICRIATNKGLDYVRRAQRRIEPADETSLLALLEVGKTSVEDEVIEQDMRQRLYEACCSLHPPYDSVAVDYFCKEMTAAEIASARNKKEKTIQTQIYRARAMLRKIWKGA